METDVIAIIILSSIGVGLIAICIVIDCVQDYRRHGFIRCCRDWTDGGCCNREPRIENSPDEIFHPENSLTSEDELQYVV